MTSQNRMEYGVDGVNELPKGWVSTKLGIVASFEMGQAPPGSASNFEEIGTPFVKAGEFGEIRPIIREWTTTPLKFGRAQDVFICVVGATAGKLNLGADCAIGRSVAAIRPETAELQKFLYYQMLPRVLEMRAASSGSAQGVISQKDLSKLDLLLPPAAEQTRIVAKLEELLSELDAGVAELKAAQKKLGQYRQSLLKAAVSGELTTKWRAAHALNTSANSENGQQLLQRILQERRNRWQAKQLAKFHSQGKTPPKDWQSKYPEPMQPDTTGLPELPQGWVWATVDQLLMDIETGKSFKCEERPPHTNEVGVVKVSAVSWGEYDEEESKTCLDKAMIRPELFVNKGDLLFSRANTIELVGACVIVQTVTKHIMLSDKILRLVLVDKAINVWLLTLLRSQFGRKNIETLASGNQESMRNIGQEKLRQIPVPLPCLDEVKAASDLLLMNVAAAKEQETAITHALKQAAAQRQNILRAAFAGRLVPQDPADEPASVLLERIRTERATAASRPKKPRGRPAKESA